MMRSTYIAALLALASFATAQTRTSCSVAAYTPPPAGYVCNQQGTISKPASTFNGSTADQAECRDLCVNAENDCASFSYGPGHTCKTYYNPVKSSGFKSSTTSKTFFWGRACFNQTCGLCSKGLSACGQFCKNLNTDKTNCGSCYNYCQGGMTCQTGQCKCPAGMINDNGTCRPPCPKGEIYCSGTCTNTQTDINNCGSCGNACGQGSCQAGTCTCGANAGYCSPQTCSPFNTNQNCGGCNISCGGGSSCQNMTCTCPTGQSFCNGSCTDLSSDVNNCGTCGNNCGSNAMCTSSQCQCNAGFNQCNSGCSDLQTDPNNCGNCQNKIPSGDTCCSGAPANTTSDPNNCNVCGNVCSGNQSCYQSACTCNPGTGDYCVYGDQCISGDMSQGGAYPCGKPMCCYCAPAQEYSIYSGDFHQYYSGYGVRRSTNDVTHQDTFNNVYEGEGRPCAALSEALGTFNSNPNEYIGSVTLYWDIANQEWHFDRYAAYDDNPSSFNQDDSNTGLSFGYYNSNPPISK